MVTKRTFVRLFVSLVEGTVAVCTPLLVGVVAALMLMFSRESVACMLCSLIVELEAVFLKHSLAVFCIPVVKTVMAKLVMMRNLFVVLTEKVVVAVGVAMVEHASLHWDLD